VQQLTAEVACRPSFLALQGPALFDLLDSIDSAARDPYAPFRMPIMDRYK
jgi:translation elongation factor EF-1alpha